MDFEKLDKIIEGILFVNGNSIDIKELTDKLELQQSEVKQAVKKLTEKYSGDSGIHLLSFNGKIQLSSNPAYADTISTVLNPIREKELSRATLEVVAIIAYKQPITRLEIEHVRGVNSDYAVQMLLNHNLIRAVGRKDTIGKPLLFGTTDEFLKRFKLSSLEDLPDYEELLEQINVVPAAPQEGLYHEFDIPEDAIMSQELQDKLNADEEIPDFLEGEEIERIE